MSDWVTLGDVEGEMDDFKHEKEVDEFVLLEMNRALMELCKHTAQPLKIGERKIMLTAARVCEIETRLRYDSSLQLDADAEDRLGGELESTNVRALVKRNLVRTY